MKQIVIAGAGALGSFLAARFLGCTKNVRLLARGERLATLQNEGLTLQIDSAEHIYPVHASDSCADIDKADLIVLACKTIDLCDLLEKIHPIVGEKTTLLTVQNGVEAPNLVAEAFPQARIIASKVHGFFELEGAAVRHVGVQPHVTFGMTHGDGLNPETALADLLAEAEIGHSMSPDIWAELWEKLLLAASLGSVGTAFNIPAGSIMADKNASDILAKAMQEVAELAKIRHIKLAAQCVEQSLAFAAEFPADATTSLQRDLEAKRPSEYASLTGGVLRLGQEAGADMPTFERLDAMIRARGLIT